MSLILQRELLSAQAAGHLIPVTLRRLSQSTRLLHVCERGAGETVAHRSLRQAMRPQSHHGAILNHHVACFINTITPLRTKKVATSDKPELLSLLKTWLS